MFYFEWIEQKRWSYLTKHVFCRILIFIEIYSNIISVFDRRWQILVLGVSINRRSATMCERWSLGNFDRCINPLFWWSLLCRIEIGLCLPERYPCSWFKLKSLDQAKSIGNTTGCEVRSFCLACRIENNYFRWKGWQEYGLQRSACTWSSHYDLVLRTSWSRCTTW
mgnify:CR=1 FL=1